MTGTSAIADALRDHFARHGEGVTAAYLYGSIERGTQHRGSDVDVGVLFAVPPPSTLAGLPVELEAELTKLTGRQAQVVVMNEAPRNEYFDLLPILRRWIETGVTELRTMAQLDRIAHDIRERRAIRDNV
jgi:predicted nucleotidyltransferase